MQMSFDLTKKEQQEFQLKDLKNLLEKLEDSGADLDDFKKLDSDDSKMSETEKKLFKELKDKSFSIDFIK
jgi:hypothetical protein